MLSIAAFCAPARTTLRETESGAHYDTEEDPRSVAPAKLCSEAGRSSPVCTFLRGSALTFAVAPPRSGEHDADAAVCRNPQGRLPRHEQRSLGCGSGSMSAPFNGVSCGSLRPFPLHAHASPSPGRPRHGQRSLGCGSGSMSAPFYGVSCGSLRPFPLHATRVRVRSACPRGLLCRSACQGEWPLAAPRFACALADRRASERAQGSERCAASGSHCRGSACGGAIPESHRRGHAGLNQRFPNGRVP
jgi:hypothetical protein